MITGSKRAVLLGALVIAISSDAGHAASVADVVDELNAEVPARCMVLAPAIAEGDGAAVSVSTLASAGGVVTANVAFRPLADQSDATLTVPAYGNSNPDAGAPNARISFPAACNFAGAFVALSAQKGGIFYSGSGNFPNFASGLAYAARVEWPSPASAIASFVPAGNPLTTNSSPFSSPTNGTLSLLLRPYATISNGAVDPRPNRPLVAGSYTETLRIRLGLNP